MISSSEWYRHSQCVSIRLDASCSTCTVHMFLSSQVVRERLVCHGIVGHQGCKEHIMSVDVTCRFVAPMLSISSKQLNFYMEKVGQKIMSRIFFIFKVFIFSI